MDICQGVYSSATPAEQPSPHTKGVKLETRSLEKKLPYPPEGLPAPDNPLNRTVRPHTSPPLAAGSAGLCVSPEQGKNLISMALSPLLEDPDYLTTLFGSLSGPPMVTPSFSTMVAEVYRRISSGEVPFRPEMKISSFSGQLNVLREEEIQQDLEREGVNVPSVNPQLKIHTLYDKYYAKSLEIFGLDEDAMRRLAEPGTKIGLVSDPVIDRIKKDNLDPGLTLMGENPAKLTSPELKPVLTNICRSVEADINTLPEILKPHYQLLAAEAKQLLAMYPGICYLDTLCLCIKYSLMHTLCGLQDFPDRYYEKVKAEKQSLASLKIIFDEITSANAKTLGRVLDKYSDQLEIFRRGKNGDTQYNSYFFQIEQWLYYGRKTRLVWPTFEELTLDFFNKASRYKIFPVGLTREKLCYHDAQLMLPIDLLAHDYAHAENTHLMSFAEYNYQQMNIAKPTPGAVKYLTSEKVWSLPPEQLAQSEFLTDINAVLTALEIHDPLIHEAIDLVLFCAFHETGFMNYRLISDSGEVLPVFSSERFFGYLYQHLPYFKTSPELQLQHIHYANFLLMLITSCKIKTSERSSEPAVVHL